MVVVGRPNVRVYIRASLGLFGAGGVREAITDSEGNAYIDFDDFGQSFHGEIYVAGKRIYDGEIMADDIKNGQPEPFN